MDDDTEGLFKTSFRIISNSSDIPFDYERSKEGLFYTTASDHQIDIAEDSEMIEVVDRKVPYKREMFMGRPEAILNGSFKIIQPSGDGSALEEVRIGGYKCRYCGEITYVEQEDGKKCLPFKCDNCERKGHFKPAFPEELLKPIWKLPIGALECSPVLVYADVYNFIKEYLVLKEEEYHLMTLWIMATYLVDDFKTVPYLLFIAPKESGKSQAIIMLKELAYRAFIAASVTAASLFRAIELWKISMLIDEAETQVTNDTESGQALYQTLNMGYKRGSYALRVEGDARIPTRFDVFGFKAIASTKIFLPTLESRSIIINMSQGKPEKIIIDEMRSDVIRSELLYFRFRSVGKLNIIQPKSNSGRIIEIMTPLFTVAQIFKGLDGIKTIISYDEIQKILNDKIKDLENIRSDEEHGSIEAQVTEQIQELIKTASVEEMDIKIKAITMKLGWIDEYSDTQKVKEASAKIGRVLKVMGIATHRTGHGFVIEHKKPEVMDRINKAVKRYLKNFVPEIPVDDVIFEGMGKSQRERIQTIKSIIQGLQADHKGNAPRGNIILKAIDSGFKDDEIEVMLRSLKSSGDLIESSNGMYRLV